MHGVVVKARLLLERYREQVSKKHEKEKRKNVGKKNAQVTRMMMVLDNHNSGC